MERLIFFATPATFFCETLRQIFFDF
jgi:hypothetical protein